MSHLGYLRVQAARAAGIPARFPGVCHRCGQDIAVGERIVPTSGGFVHVGCAKGADDE